MNPFLADLYGTEQNLGIEKVGMDKQAEQDFLGRMMAHAYVQELNDIEKQAGILEVAKRVGGKVLDHAMPVGEAIAGKLGKAEGIARQAARGLKGNVIRPLKQAYLTGRG
jgi:hypothetical protein